MCAEIRMATVELLGKDAEPFCIEDLLGHCG
jgi:hypothetical protein